MFPKLGFVKFFDLAEMKTILCSKQDLIYYYNVV